MTNYKSAFGKVCRIKNRHTFKSMPILNSAYFTECRRHIVIPCGKVCRIKNRHTFKVCRIKNRHTFKSMPILNSAYHAVKYAELRIGILLKVCRFVIRHITQTQTETQTEAVRSHVCVNRPFQRQLLQLINKHRIEIHFLQVGCTTVGPCGNQMTFTF